MPKVSIIVTAYNIEKYITRCIQSIVKQTFSDIEIIIINDGSTDNTLNQVINEQKRDSRIKLITIKNKGVVEARKRGLNEAKGDYVLFIDGDDWIEYDAIDKLYAKAISKNYDIVCYKYILAYENSALVKEVNDISELEKKDIIKLFLLGSIKPSVWSKFIKRSFIEKNSMIFQNQLAYGEDLVFTFYLMVENPRISILNEHLYYYYQRQSSVTKSTSNKIFDIRKSVFIIAETMKENNIYNKYKSEFEYFSFIHNYWNLKNIINDVSNKYSKILFKSWKKMKINIIKNSYYKKLIKNESLKSKINIYLFERHYSYICIFNFIKSIKNNTKKIINL